MPRVDGVTSRYRTVVSVYSWPHSLGSSTLEEKDSPWRFLSSGISSPR